MEQKHTNILDSLLDEFLGTRDVMLLDYKSIDTDTIKERLDFKNVRGSIRLFNQKIKVPSDLEAKRNSFINMKIP